MSSEKPAPKQADPVQIDLAEFAALRAEILTFLNLQNAFLGVAAAITTGVIYAAASDKPERLYMVRCAPTALAILAGVYADLSARTGRAGCYIGLKLSGRLGKQLPGSVPLGWERFIREDYRHKRLLLWTDKLRYFFFFFLPALLADMVSLQCSATAPCRVPPDWLRPVGRFAWLAAIVLIWCLESVARESIDRSDQPKQKK